MEMQLNKNILQMDLKKLIFCKWMIGLELYLKNKTQLKITGFLEK